MYVIILWTAEVAAFLPPSTPQHALEQEMKRNAEAVNETISPQGQKAYLDTLADSLSLPNKPRNPLRVDDVVRKNEVGGGGGEMRR